MQHEGRHFETLPFLDKYLHREPAYPEIDYSAAKGDLLREMQITKAYLETHPEAKSSGHFREPWYVPICHFFLETIAIMWPGQPVFTKTGANDSRFIRRSGSA